jgi:hypothetical protein
MATGENTTTWGDVTNLNLGTALEEAIVGSDDVTFASANVTLTLADDNGSQTARNMRLRCTGTTGGSTRNLVVPSIEKPYIVQNDCADSIVVKTAAGSGVTVPAGKTMWVYANGTDVVNVVTHVSSLTIATALPAASGGTGNNTYAIGDLLYASGTTTLSKLADVATGNALISGGVGVAPSYGKIGLTTHITGTLAVANGGSGATTLTGYVKGSGTSAFTASATIPASDIASGAALTRTNDTNVTLTLGGSPSTALLAASSLTLGWTGTLAISRGGTGSSSTTYCNLTTNVTGTLPVANGGTGAATLTGYVKGAGTSAMTASATIPASDISSGAALTKTDDTNVTLTLGGSPTTALLAASSLTLGWSGTLAVSRGGTGAATLTGLVLGNGTSAFTTVTAPSGTVVGTSDTQTLTNKTVTQSINAQTGTTYTLAASDTSKLVTLSNAGTVTITVPPNSSVTWDIGNSVDIAQLGAGQVTVAAGVGVTIRATPGLLLRAQYSGGTLIKIATDEWLLVGDLTA